MAFKKLSFQTIITREGSGPVVTVEGAATSRGRSLGCRGLIASPPRQALVSDCRFGFADIPG